MKIKINGEEVDLPYDYLDGMIDLDYKEEFTGLKEQLRMSKTEDDAKKARTYGRGKSEITKEFAKKEGLEVKELKAGSYNTPVKFTKDQETYFEMMRKRLLNPKNKKFDLGFEMILKKACCEKPNKYRNGIGGMKFWSCSNCGADLGNIV